MVRKMIDANRRLFERLDEFCVSRGSVPKPGSGYKFIEGDDAGDDVIKHLKLGPKVQFGPQKLAVHATLRGDDFIILAGFGYLDEYVNTYSEFGADLEEIEFLPCHAVVLLSEIHVRPVASGLEVQAYVEVADSTVESYQGHDIVELKRLFPRLTIFRSRSRLSERSFYQIMTKFAVAESAYAGGWINEALLVDLLALASISASSFPYEAISRAAFDSDPRNLYLALYRCLEATYAYKTSEDLAKALKLDVPWSELAVKLHKNLKWRPREASSLEVVLRHATENDLHKVAAALGGGGGADAASSASSLIYDLRNRIVHFSASLDSVGIDEYDWNEVCCALVGVVYDVFHRAFDSAAV